jgi:multidrug resistance efflux pump
MGDFRTTTGEPLPDSRRERRRRRRDRMRLGLWIALAAALTGLAVRVPRHVAAKGYVTSEDYAEVRAAVGGRVAEILRRSGDACRKGDTLVRLDDAVERASCEEARAVLRRLEADLVRREAELAENRRRREFDLAQAGMRRDHARTTATLYEELHAKGLASGRAVADQKLALALAESDFERRSGEDLTLDAKELDVLRRDIEARRSAVARAEAEVSARHVYAPFDGVVVRYEFAVGEQVTPDMVLYEVFGGERQILKLRVPERHAVRVRPGTPYVARLNPYGNWTERRFRGRVEALRSVIQSDSRQTYRMAYCSFDPAGRTVPPGTSAEARITVGHASLWAWLFGVY